MKKRAVLSAIGVLALGLIVCKPRPAKSESNLPVTTSANSPTVTHAHTNRLAREKSPYLLQHQHNPVDWYAWGEEAFAKARQENKPIFLSIGYSTCHWCHVMERESFENEAVAKFLNAHFVSIKVDREERPDVDKIYMTFVQATTGAGRLAVELFSDARPEAVLRRHLFSAGRQIRPAQFPGAAASRSPSFGKRAGRRDEFREPVARETRGYDRETGRERPVAHARRADQRGGAVQAGI